MLQERPFELNQKLRRIQASRDNLKANNREKVSENKALRDRNKELTESRDLWRSKNKDLTKMFANQKEDLTSQIEVANKAAEIEKKRAEKERERADFLQSEIEAIKKKSRS
jgi:hypothetical protein